MRHLLTSWRPAWQPSRSLPHTCEQALVGLEAGTYHAVDECSTDLAVPASLDPLSDCFWLFVPKFWEVVGDTRTFPNVIELIWTFCTQQWGQWGCKNIFLVPSCPLTHAHVQRAILWNFLYLIFHFYLGFTFHGYMNIATCSGSHYKGYVSSTKSNPTNSQGFALLCYQNKMRYTYLQQHNWSNLNCSLYYLITATKRQKLTFSQISLNCFFRQYRRVLFKNFRVSFGVPAFLIAWYWFYCMIQHFCSCHFQLILNYRFQVFTDTKYYFVATNSSVSFPTGWIHVTVSHYYSLELAAWNGIVRMWPLIPWLDTCEEQDFIWNFIQAPTG